MNPRLKSKTHYLNWHEIASINTIVQQLNTELRDLEKLLPTPRTKRALLDLGGHVLNFLFGTATNADLTKLHEAVEQIKDRQTAVVHSVENQLTYMKELDEDVKQNTRDVSILARTLKTMVYDILNLNRSLEVVGSVVINQVESMVNVSGIIREIEFLSLQLEQEFIKLHEGLDVTSTGKLSAVLLPPHNLSQILQQVALKLPSDVSLLAETNLEDMFVYYEAAKTHAYTTVNEIRLLIRIPLRGTDRVMNLYRTEPLPVFETLLNRHMQIIPETMYMAVTEGRQYYSLLTPADLQNCQQGVFTICESKFPLYHKATPSCSGALYFGKHNLAHEHCNKIILRKDFKPVWIHQSGNPNFGSIVCQCQLKLRKYVELRKMLKVLI
jgi:hypothetical protein